MTLSNLTSKIEELKIEKSNKFTDFKVMFNETSLYFSGVLISEKNKKGEDARRRGLFTLANVFVPTVKGYVSTQWKKSEFFKAGNVEASLEMIEKLLPFLQEEKPTTYVDWTSTLTVAGAIAHHTNDAGSALEEYSK